MKDYNTILRKSVILVFVFVLLYSFSVYGYVLEDEVYSDKVIADSVAFLEAQENQPISVKSGARTVSLASSPQIVIWAVLNTADTYTDKYKPVEVYRGESELHVLRYMKNFFPSTHRYASSWTGPNDYNLSQPYEFNCWFSYTLPGVICDMKFRLPSDAPVGTYTVERTVYDRQTGDIVYGPRKSYNYLIFNPYDSNSDVGGLDSASIKAYAYDPSKGGRDETGVWFSADEYIPFLSLRWHGIDAGENFIKTLFNW
ncbi:hypothetical protein FJZ53_02855 [Candidatus Woesearchaeota archaeon]|nr:hypothetical protein [Candidatus Woesearchaeota archaeon]